MTSRSTLHDLSTEFHRLHAPGAGVPLVLPNAWDVMSARLIEEAGASAIATTSAGVAWALGRPDGEVVTRDQMIDVVRRIASAVHLPVTADVEGGYGVGTPRDVAETVRRVIDAGAAGINLEDGSRGDDLYATSEQVERIAAARSAAAAEEVPLFINARIDVYLRGVGSDAERLDLTVERARAYVAAGADGIFVPGVVDGETIRQLVPAVGAPLNVMAGQGSPGIGELHEMGVVRVSVGPAIALTVMAEIRRASVELLRHGSYGALRDRMEYTEANALFAQIG